MQRGVLMGVGNIFSGDDGVGPYIARNVNGEVWTAFDCGTFPEAFTGKLRQMQPEEIVIVDAALMNLIAGEFRRIDPVSAGGVTFTTHNMSLSLLATAMSEFCSDITLIGIQPAQLELPDELSPIVLDAAKKLITILNERNHKSISIV